MTTEGSYYLVYTKVRVGEEKTTTLYAYPLFLARSDIKNQVHKTTECEFHFKQTSKKNIFSVLFDSYVW